MTATNSCAVQMSSTITVSASGDVDSTATFYPAISCEPFANLSIAIVPRVTCRYTVEVFHHGELEETHTFPSTTNKYVCYMSFGNLIFPANIGTNTIPAYFRNNDFPGIAIAVKITNLTDSQQTFLAYTTFLEYDHCRFGKIETISLK